MKRSIDYDFTCYQEEADSKIAYHICQIQSNYRITVHCTDSDIPTILLANFDYRKGQTEVIVDLSVGKKKQCLNINAIHKSLGDPMTKALAVCHIFTGNDFNPSFYRKGKKKAFRILTRTDKYRDPFIQLLHTSPSEINFESNIFKSIEEFVCKIYGLKITDVNKGRYELFEKGYKINNLEENVLKKKLVGYDASSLPPTKVELLQQIKRTIHISSIWCNAYMKTPTDTKPENCGWVIMDGSYDFHWFDGPMSPTFLDILPDVGMYTYNKL